MKNIKFIFPVFLLIIISTQCALFGENHFPIYKLYAGPNLPPEKIAILRPGDNYVLLEKVDGVKQNWKGGYEIQLVPGMHYLTVFYSSEITISNGINLDGKIETKKEIGYGRSIVIPFDAKAGKQYKIRSRIFDDKWSAWAADENPDQSNLTYAVTNDEDSDSRREAVENLADQAILAFVAKNDQDMDVRRAAVEKLTDQALLAEIAKIDKDKWVRFAAVKNPSLTDQFLLADIAGNDKENRVREAAKERLRELKKK